MRTRGVPVAERTGRGKTGMETSQTESYSKKDREKNKRLLRKYGITLTQYNRRRVEQEDKCKICGGPLNAYGPPHVDHFHAKVKAYRATEGDKWFPDPGAKWVAQASDERGRVAFVAHAPTKKKAIEMAKAAYAPYTVRGLLDSKCNKGLGYIERFFGAAANPAILDKVRDYLASRLT